MPTLKQQIAAQKTFENLGNRGKALKEAGYSQNVVNNPKIVTESKGYQEAITPYIEKLKKEKEKALEQMELKRDDASYADLRQAVDSFTKLEQLLSGEPTENLQINIVERYEIKD